LPNVIRSGVTPSSPHQPDRWTRNPLAALSQPGGEAGARGDDAHVGRCGFGDDAGDVLAVVCKGALDSVEVVVGQDERVAGLRAGHSRGVGQPERRNSRTRRGEQRIDVAVVAAGELDHLGASSEAAGEPDRRHGGLGTGADQPHPVDRRNPADDLLGECDLAFGGCAVRSATGGRLLHRLDHRGVGVAEDQPARPRR
jgi:hypothetical protein